MRYTVTKLGPKERPHLVVRLAGDCWMVCPGEGVASIRRTAMPIWAWSPTGGWGPIVEPSPAV